MTANEPSRDGPAGRPTEPLANPEAALGGADAVEKTSAVVGRGTEPEAMSGGRPAASNLPSGRGPNLLAWTVGAVALAIGLIYLLGLLR